MRSIDGRLSKLERRFGIAPGNRLLLIVTGVTTLALDQDSCVKILDEAGFLPASGTVRVDLFDIPPGLNANETKRFLQENGAEICWPRLANGPRGPGST